MKITVSKFITVLMISLASSAALAAAPTPDISNALRQIPAPPPQQKPQPVIPTLGPKEAPQLKMAEGIKIEVKKIIVIGNEVVSHNTLHELVKSAEGKILTLAGLEEVAARITNYYRSRGYLVARAYLPAQDVKDGIITIRVIEGNYGKITVNNTSLVKSPVVLGIVDNVRKEKIVSAGPVERAILLVNDLPGAVVTRTYITPGEKVGTSDFVVDTAPMPRMNGYAMADNYGSIYTGKYRLTAGADLNSPLGIGDKISASGLITDGQYLKNYRLAYSAPLTSNGLRGEVAGSKTSYQLTDAFSSLDAVGTAETIEGTLTYPFKRTRAFTVEGALNLAHKKLTDQVNSTSTITPKTADAATASFKSTAEDYLFGKSYLSGTTVISASATMGSLDFRDATAKALDAAGANTQGRYGKLDLALDRTTQLPERWELETSFKIQKALFDKNLDGSEDMSVSGMGGVKAYPSGELAAENAYLIDAELRYNLPLQGDLNLKLGVFGDVGRAEMENQVGTTGPRSLSDVGASLYATYKNLFSTLQIATRTAGMASSESVPSTRVFLQVGSRF